ncbi:hypothetical protein [Beijerinckia indica]|uniref:Thiol:disulfide interchange protein DsbG n=1 Tax=Beijerinckia indica subsp. indica (strain ATCC 9039 / DSM 1715 / NCIMB 8712) TaxID=395963 RepID=B2ILH9_BEII9|nr:hypothetical protein [Beijerinckia indica]ACB97379.1 hypothetical protein Bind_3850 [Beijerinckia indica subsp. indica ATCC 9039]
MRSIPVALFCLMPFAAAGSDLSELKQPSERVVEEPTLPPLVPGLSDRPSTPYRSEGINPDLPVLKHIAESGAKLSELGAMHGLQRVLVRRDKQFMILNVTPDGEAIIAGLQSDFPFDELKKSLPIDVTELQDTHAIKGLFVRNGHEFQVLYLTPDGQNVIPGVMWDATGHNITRDQVSSIEGAIPRVEIKNDTMPAVAVSALDGKPSLSVVKETSFGTYGRSGAPRLWIFVDPLCSFSIRAMDQLRSYATRGEIELAVVPVSIIDHEDGGKSTEHALSMLSLPRETMVAAWRNDQLNNPVAAEARDRLTINMAAAEVIHLRGTPTLLWQKEDGSEGRLDGLASDWDRVIASMRH